jgi:hypothetical protein
MRIVVGQARAPYAFQMAKSASLTTGCVSPCRRTALRMLSASFSVVNLAL